MSIARLVEIAENYAPIYKVNEGQESTNAYVDVVRSLVNRGGLSHLTYVFGNIGAGTVAWKVLGSVDGTAWSEIEAETTLAAAASATWSASDAEISASKYFKVQVKSSVENAEGEITVVTYARL
ncbi:MAG: hypothetical protein PHW93_06995 [Candidatus Methanomethylophilaceae archaeon]|nr:hypothetical protein [Candidatus Methanomethylophilaceae archaeon]